MFTSLVPRRIVPTLYKTSVVRFSTLNPVQQAERVTEVRNVLNSVDCFY